MEHHTNTKKTGLSKININFLIFRKVFERFTIYIEKNKIAEKNSLKILYSIRRLFPNNIKITDLLYCNIKYNTGGIQWLNSYEDLKSFESDKEFTEINYVIFSEYDISFIKKYIKIWSKITNEKYTGYLTTLNNFDGIITNYKSLILNNTFNYEFITSEAPSGGYIYFTGNNNELLNFILDIQNYKIAQKLIEDIKEIDKELYNEICKAIIESNKLILLKNLINRTLKECFLKSEIITDDELKVLSSIPDLHNEVFIKIAEFLFNSEDYTGIIQLIQSSNILANVQKLKQYIVNGNFTITKQEYSQIINELIESKLSLIYANLFFM